MRLSLILLYGIVLLLFASCTTSNGSRSDEGAALQRYFDEVHANGVFVLYDLSADRVETNDPARAEQAFIPASTFKIFNALVALETGTVLNADQVLVWDGQDRGSAQWNKDQNLRTAFQYSVVWAFQDIARRIGPAEMARYLSLAGYGNQDFGGGIDTFWLTGDLRITPKQQIDFLVRLHQNDLPFSQRSMDIVKDIMVREQTADYVLRGKTGWANAFTPGVGWFVGYLTRGDEAYFFATELDVVDEDQDIPARVDITMAILRERGLLR